MCEVRVRPQACGPAGRARHARVLGAALSALIGLVAWASRHATAPASLLAAAHGPRASAAAGPRAPVRTEDGTNGFRGAQQAFDRAQRFLVHALPPAGHSAASHPGNVGATSAVARAAQTIPHRFAEDMLADTAVHALVTDEARLVSGTCPSESATPKTGGYSQRSAVLTKSQMSSCLLPPVQKNDQADVFMDTKMLEHFAKNFGFGAGRLSSDKLPATMLRRIERRRTTRRTAADKSARRAGFPRK